MKIISKRARAEKVPNSTAPGIPGLDVYESSIIIITDGSMSPADIKRAEEVFRELRRQLEDIDITISIAAWDLWL